MEGTNPDKLIPEQEKGASTNTDHSYEAATVSEARELYSQARNRLLDINNWGEYSGKLSADFALTDEQGQEVSREVQANDHFRINIPGPGTVTGDGYDWVQVEKIEEESNDQADEETIGIRVRPADNPNNQKSDVAHFFSDDATSNFILKRQGKVVTAGVYGRNEVPNTETDSIVDKARNAAVGVTAGAGVSKLQWHSLVKGIIGK